MLRGNIKVATVFAGLTFALGALAGEIAPGLHMIDPYTIAGPKNFLTGFAPTNADGSVNVVVEIPTGTVAKWEVAKLDGKLKWEFRQGKPRVVKYLGYPGNYGMLPRTLLAKDEGGDGDPLDVIVLGETVPRGAVVKARAIGVLRLLDGGEADDKIIAVLETSPMARVKSPDEMNQEFPGVLAIIRIWFEGYKGPGEIISRGYAGPEAALKTIEAAIATYQDRNASANRR